MKVEKLCTTNDVGFLVLPYIIEDRIMLHVIWDTSLEDAVRYISDSTSVLEEDILQGIGETKSGSFVEDTEEYLNIYIYLLNSDDIGVIDTHLETIRNALWGQRTSATYKLSDKDVDGMTVKICMDVFNARGYDVKDN